MVTNQTVMIGPNSLPMRSVPCDCSANRPTSTNAASGTMKGAIFGAGISRPSSALKTEIAGVIAPSP